MKKILITFAVLASSLICRAQDFSVDAASIGGDLTRVYETASNSAAQKHLLSKEWVAKSFGDYKSVLQFEDDSNCKIIVKGFSAMSDDSKLSYAITIDAKDDKYRVQFSDLLIKDYVLQVSRLLKSDASTTALLNAIGANKPEFIEMKYANYVSVTDDIENSYKRIDEAKARLAVIDDEISARIAEFDLEIKEKKNKPRGMTGSLYSGNLKKEKAKYIEEAQREKEALPETIQREYKNIKEYEQRVVDVENALSGLLKSLYLKLNASDDF